MGSIPKPAVWGHEEPPSDEGSGDIKATKEQSKAHVVDENMDQVVEDEKEATESPIERTVSRRSQMELSTARKVALVVTLTGATFLNTLSVQAAVIVLPTIGRALDIAAPRQQWVVSSYALAFGCFLLLWGRLADVYGKRLIFVSGSAWVCIVTLVCPFIPNEIGFDVMRGLQGFGAAANVPTAIGILAFTFPPGKAKAYAFSVFSSGAPMGSVVGNILGGVVGQYAGWKWIFWILAMLAAVVTVAGYYVIPLPIVRPAASDLNSAVDWIGGALITVALFALLFALTEGNVAGWSTSYIIVVLVLSVALLVAFVFWQLHLENKTTRRPLLKMSVFRNLRVCAAMFIMAMFFSSFNNFLIFATYYYQDYNGLDPIETTLRFIPTGVAGLLTILVVSQLLARIKVQYIVIFGTLCCITCNLLFAVPISPSTIYWAFGFPAMAIGVMGADTLFPSLVLFTTQSLPKEDQAIGGALINASGQIGRAIGLAIATAIEVAVQDARQGSDHAAASTADDLHNAAYLAGLRAANWFSAALGVAALIVAIFAFRGTGIVGAAAK